MARDGTVGIGFMMSGEVIASIGYLLLILSAVSLLAVLVYLNRYVEGATLGEAVGLAVIVVFVLLIWLACVIVLGLMVAAGHFFVGLGTFINLMEHRHDIRFNLPAMLLWLLPLVLGMVVIATLLIIGVTTPSFTWFGLVTLISALVIYLIYRASQLLVEFQKNGIVLSIVVMSILVVGAVLLGGFFAGAVTDPDPATAWFGIILALISIGVLQLVTTVPMMIIYAKRTPRNGGCPS